jgi:polyisoprenoid-binding protein YceI
MEAKRSGRAARRVVVGGSALVVVLVASAYAYWKHSIDVPARYKTVTYTVPEAPRLAAAAGQVVYRIDPTRSQLQYEIAEKIVGATAGHAKGTTNGIAGDIAVDASQPSASKVGEIVADVEQLHSDQDLRDARIRKDFLESRTHPLATFTTSGFSGLPPEIVTGRSYRYTMVGTAHVKDTTAPISWDVTASVAKGALVATAVAHTKLSTFGAGPISVAGLVSTSDAVTLTMRLTAVDPSTHAVPTEISAPPGVRGSGAGPSFRRTILPVLEQDCAACHNAGQVGAEHWQLDKAGDAAAVATGLGTVVKAKYMPPWPASDLGVPLAHSKALPQATIDQIVAWSRAGGHLDVPASTPIKPALKPSALQPRHDLVLRMVQPYEGSLTVPNDYRCFVLDPKVTTPTFLTGYEFLGDQIAEIHHAQVFQIPADQRAALARTDGADGKPGWSCYAGPGVATRQVRGGGGGGQGGLIAGWVPGQDPVVYGAHAGVLLAPGDVLVLQLHYHHDTVPPTPDRSGIALQLDPPSAGLRPIRIVNPLGPVEIPCMPGATAPLCDRNTALVADAQQYGPIGAFAEPGLLALCRQTVDSLTAGFDGVARSSCDTRVPESGVIIGAMGHMHTLGQSFRLTLDPATPQQRVLLDIPIWNFDWQMNYGFAAPLHVEKGQTIRMECSWDRSLDPNRPQKYIVFAEGTEDEMCFSTYALIPDAG